MTPQELPDDVVATAQYIFESMISRLRGSEAMSRLEVDYTDGDNQQQKVYATAYMTGVADTFEALAKGLQSELDRFNEMAA